MEDDDLENEDDLSQDLVYNYDVINLKEETSPFHTAVKDTLIIYSKHVNSAGDSKTRT